MILQNATIQYSGIDPSILTKGSHKRICVSCDKCGRIRWVSKYAYRDLCVSCTQVGRTHSDAAKRKIGNAHKGKKNSNYGTHRFGKNSHGWKGGKVILVCKYCNKKYSVYPSEVDKSNFCSHDCQYIWNSENCKGKNSSNWKGGISGNRDHVLTEEACIKLNERFDGSHFHHITKSVGVFIPKELHKHIYHNLKSGQNMGEINLLALQFINGSL